MTTTETWPPIPAWERADLTSLAAQGQLSGVDPIELAVIDQAESSGQGGGINSSGYGGFFGLGVGSAYPRGTPTTSLLGSPSEQSFDSQAVIAGSAFAKYLSEAGGNPVTAEEIYQSGSASGPTEGSRLMSEFLGGGTGSSSPSSASSTPATLTGLNANPFDLFGIPQTIAGSAASSIWSEVGPFIVKSMLVVAGLGIILLGAYRVAAPKLEGARQDAAQAAPAAALAAA